MCRAAALVRARSSVVFPDPAGPTNSRPRGPSEPEIADAVASGEVPKDNGEEEDEEEEAPTAAASTSARIRAGHLVAEGGREAAASQEEEAVEVADADVVPTPGCRPMR